MPDAPSSEPDRTSPTPGFPSADARPAGSPSPESSTLHVRIPSSLQYVRFVRKMLEGLLASEGWAEDDVADAGLVATEVVQNAVEHGSRNDGGEAVDVRCAFETNGSGGSLVVEVRDPGTGKGVRSLLERDVTHPPADDAARGRGLYLVHRLSHGLDRSQDGAGGSLVRVRIRRVPGATGTAS